MSKKILLVSGASSDVGIELIKNIGKEYDCIWAHYYSDMGKFECLPQQIREKMNCIKCDFSSLEETNVFVNSILEDGRLPSQMIFLASPKAKNVKFHKQAWGDWEYEFDSSVRSAVLLSKAFLPTMTKEKYGRIVFMLTSYVEGIPPKYISSYVSMKYCLLGLMKSLSAEYSGKGVTINGISPDMMETEFVSELPHLVVEDNADKNPLKRNIRTSDLVGAFRLLLSDEGEAITGQNILITGGVR